MREEAALGQGGWVVGDLVIAISCGAGVAADNK
jgi:hypothetical protein